MRPILQSGKRNGIAGNLLTSDPGIIHVSSSQSNENLIAYLDGELPEDEASAVEQSLVEDAGVRRDVEQLSRTYDLLDLLPALRASDGFAEKTLTAIRSVQPESPSESESDRVSTRPQHDFSRRLTFWAVRVAAFCGLLVAAQIGFNSSFRQNSESIDELLLELPLIERLDEYREIGDVQFLRSLSESRLLDEQDDQSQH